MLRLIQFSLLFVIFNFVSLSTSAPTPQGQASDGSEVIQCASIGFSRPCAEGFQCVYYSAWYSQCEPKEISSLCATNC
ncbi:hypothetical protein BDQ17DRAFT_1368827, partial [Cyathus striatus]